jgi:hypothetical protein
MPLSGFYSYIPNRRLFWTRQHFRPIHTSHHRWCERPGLQWQRPGLQCSALVYKPVQARDMRGGRARWASWGRERCLSRGGRVPS